jgi:hypothetical protein
MKKIGKLVLGGLAKAGIQYGVRAAVRETFIGIQAT